MKSLQRSELDNKLFDLYSKPGPGYFTNPANLFRLAKERKLPVTRAAVNAFVKRSHVRNVTQTIPKLRQKYSRPYIVTRVGKAADIDLMEIPRGSRFKYILILTEYMSRKVFAKPQVNKTATATAKNLAKLYREHPEAITDRVLHDAGGEFARLSHPKVKFETTYGDQKASKSENAIYRLRKKLRQMETAYNQHDYTKLLKDALHAINSAYQPRLGYSSNQIIENPNLAGKIFQRQFGKHFDIKRQENLFEKLEPEPLKTNDLVRIQRILPYFKKGSYNWSEELFRISRVNREIFPTTYKVKSNNIGDREGDIIGSFYRFQLQKAEPGAEKKFRIEKVLQKKQGKYRVDVKGLPPHIKERWLTEKEFKAAKAPFLP